jgi:DNA-binding response OmpR family regulator
MIRQRPPVAVIVDLLRPGSSGCDLCRTIANLIPGLPLVILSTSSDVADKVLLLEMGADDHVTIPFSPKELVARLRGIIDTRIHMLDWAISHRLISNGAARKLPT